MTFVFWIAITLLAIAIVTRLILLILSPITQFNKLPHPASQHYQFIDPNTGKLHYFPSLFDEERSMLMNDENASAAIKFPDSLFTRHVSLSLIVPCYNEELRLPLMLDSTISYFEQRLQTVAGFSYEIVLVDDGSKDKTAQVALRYVEKYSADKVRLLRLKFNQGKGAAVQQGMLHARGELLLMADADGATRIQDYEVVEEKMLQCVEKKRKAAVVVIGSRAHLQQQAIAQRAFLRNLLMHAFHFLVSCLCRVNVHDTQCGFKLFTRSAAQQLFFNQHLKRWCFDVELLFMAAVLKMQIVEVPVNWHEVEGSKVKIVEASVLMARDLMLIKFAYMTRIWQIIKPTAEVVQPIVERKIKRIR